MITSAEAQGHSGRSGSPIHQGRTFLLRRIAAILTVVFAIVAPITAASAAGAGPAETFHLHVPGVAEFIYSTCPYGDWVAPTDTVCEDWMIQYFRHDIPSQPGELPWTLAVHRWVWIAHPDLTFTDLYATYGWIENPQGSFDLKRYAYAQVNGAVPMSDGSAVAVDLVWDMALAELHHGGNDSAYNPVNGIDRHYNDRCVTINQFAHQQWRWGTPDTISGTVGGIEVHSLGFIMPGEPFTAGKSVFTCVTAQHGGCTIEYPMAP
jgi:hypothetical protein